MNDGPTAPPQARSVNYDPAFRPAIEAGFLTARQAIQRGHRDRCAATLASRHGLALELALDVADNRLSLGQALRQQRSPEPDAVTQQESRHSLRNALLALGVPLALFVGALAWHASMTSRAASASLDSPTVLTDVAGSVTKVASADPASVLGMYCDAMRVRKPYQPVGLLQAARGASRLRVGILVDPANAERLLAIPIRLDPATGQWSAGDGVQPLVALLAPHNAAASIERLPTAAAETSAAR